MTVKKTNPTLKNRLTATIFMTLFTLSLLTSCTAKNASSAVTSSGSSSAASGTAASTIPAASILVDYDSTDEDSSWDNASAAKITLNKNAITFDGKGASVDGNVITITSAGTYVISGTLSDGQIVVDAKGQTVRLVLNGADITCSTSSPIYVKSSQKTILILADGTNNKAADNTAYILDDSESDEPDAVIFSKSDLTINGSGSLTVDGNYNRGINSKDSLKIVGGVITVDAVGDGIRGKDCIAVKNTSITVRAESDGMQSSNATDTAKGWISIENSTIIITSGNDGIQAQTSILVTSGEISIMAGGGSANGKTHTDSSMGNFSGGKTAAADMGTTASTAADTGSAVSSDSMKGIKAEADISINGGSIMIDSADDSIHANSSVHFSGGILNLSTGDDGIHANAVLEVNGGEITIVKSYEGLESALITINDGTLHVTSSDDGFNASSGSTATSATANQMQGGDMAADANANLYINGGYIVVDASGDGLDSNGSIYMKAGTVLVSGPTNDGNGALDYAGSFRMTGGVLVAAGSSGMAQSPDATSTQNAVLINLDSTQAAGTLFHIEGTDGKDILTFSPAKQYSSVVLCSPDLAVGSTYKVNYGGTSTGTETDGLYSGGSYTAGTDSTGFTVSGAVTTVGTVSGGMGQGGVPGQGGMKPGAGKGTGGMGQNAAGNITPVPAA